ncbi:MAG: hypothetical protein R3281_07835 [Balneolaceae bacterium]|nr:hypothetical protein [Balneolaceae bacterium]
MRTSLFFLVLMLLFGRGALSQDAEAPPDPTPDPGVAFLKSMAVPGWGHHHINDTDWTRGQYHLASEAVLVLSYIGLSVHSKNLRQNWYSYAQTRANISIADRSRSFRLAVGDFDNLQSYNDYQQRARNWDQLYADLPQNRWNWTGTGDRQQYSDLRERFENMEQQLPVLLSLMVVNRVISAISAYNRARKMKDQQDSASLHIIPVSNSGLVANVKFRF